MAQGMVEVWYMVPVCVEVEIDDGPCTAEVSRVVVDYEEGGDPIRIEIAAWEGDAEAARQSLVAIATKAVAEQAWPEWEIGF